MQELVNQIESSFPRVLLDESLDYKYSFNAHHTMYVIGPLLAMYDNNSGYHTEGVFHGISESGEFPIACSVMDKEKLREAIIWFHRVGSRSISLDYAIEKVALLQQFE